MGRWDEHDDLLIEPMSTTCLEFANREGQSEALAASARFVAGLLRSDVDGDDFRNVLTFFGGGGTGKSALSARLETWLSGGLEEDRWGQPPTLAPLTTVRWDLNASHGDLDLVSLLLTFRRALPDVPGGWRAFDLALLSYFQAARPGESIELAAGTTDNTKLVTGLLGAIAEDFVDFAVDFGAGISSHMIRSVVALARKRFDAQEMRRHELLGRIIDACNSRVSPTSPAHDVAAAVLRMATRTIRRIPDPAKRPLVVVFVDHFEKLQTDGRRSGEQAINCLVAALPVSLFVITGRNRLNWDDPSRTDLVNCGRNTWPQLALGYTDADPRQHNLGMLSPADTADVLRRRARRHGFSLSEETIAQISNRTGWPVHIDAICTLASTLAAGTGAEVSAADLDKPLEAVVRRVLENLTENHARAYHGACVLPYFDVRLAAIVAGVSEGDVEGMIARAMVEPHSSPYLPYRVHDTVREIIRAAPAHVMGGWTTADWDEAAHRGLTHLQQRFDVAKSEKHDLAVIRIMALATTIAAENGIWQAWLDRETAPAEALAPLVPSRSSHPETDARVRYLRARVSPRGWRTLKEYREIFRGSSVSARRAGLWRAYCLRAWGHPLAAVQQLEAVRVKFPSWAVPVRQIGNTLAEARRLRDALEYAETLEGDNRAYVISLIHLATGRLTDPGVLPWGPRIAKADTIRFQTDLQSFEARWLARTTGCSPEELAWRYERAFSVGTHGAQRRCLYVKACNSLADREAFKQVLAELIALPDALGMPSHETVEAQALRALLTRDPLDAERARELAGDRGYREVHWIPTECYLDALGVPLEPVPTQWLEPYDEVKERWLCVAEGIIERAGRDHP